MKSKLNDNTRITYDRGMRLQSLCLEMSIKGFPIDQFCLAELLWSLDKDKKRALKILHEFCAAVGFRAINPGSKVDVPELFYQHLGLPPIYNFDRKTKEKKLTVDKSVGEAPWKLSHCHAIRQRHSGRPRSSKNGVQSFAVVLSLRPETSVAGFILQVQRQEDCLRSKIRTVEAQMLKTLQIVYGRELLRRMALPYLTSTLRLPSPLVLDLLVAVAPISMPAYPAMFTLLDAD